MGVFYFSFKGESMYKLYNGDCLEVMDKLIKEGIKVDCILTDVPYGTTACKLDNIIPFEPMWERLNKLIKPNGAIILFGTQPFTSKLVCSNIKNFKHQWIWNKNSCNPLNAKYQPLKILMNDTKSICFTGGFFHSIVKVKEEVMPERSPR